MMRRGGQGGSGKSLFHNKLLWFRVVEYRLSTDAFRAVGQMHDSTLDGRNLIVRQEEPPTSKPGSVQSGQGQGGGAVYPMKQHIHVHRSRTRSRSLSIHRRNMSPRMERDRARCCSIFIGNLPYSVNRHQLKEAFQDFGHIVDSDVPLDERGKSKGFGVVTFSRRRDAEESIKVMDQAKFNERVVHVRFERND